MGLFVSGLLRAALFLFFFFALSVIPASCQQQTWFDHCVQGLEAQQKGDVSDAIASFEKGLHLMPPADASNLSETDAINTAECVFAHGNVYLGIGNPTKAIEYYLISAGRRPDNPNMLLNLGIAYMNSGHLNESVRSFERCSQVDPNNGKCPYHAALVFESVGDFKRAEEWYKKSAALQPSVYVYTNMGNVQSSQGLPWSAIDSFKKAAHADPMMAEPVWNLLKLLQEMFDWDGEEEWLRKLKTTLQRHISGGEALGMNPLNALNLDFTPKEVMEMNQMESRQKAAKVESLQFKRLPHNFGLERGRIRLAYMSADLGNKPVGRLVQDLFGMHNRAVFDVHCLSMLWPDNSKVFDHIKGTCENFKEMTAMSDADILQHINGLKINILIDLNGYTEFNRLDLLSHRPVPVQVTFLGYMATMGSPAIQYTIVDPVSVPPEHSAHFSEKLLVMPHSLMVTHHNQHFRFQDHTHASRAEWRRKYGLPSDGIVFISFNNLYKVSRELFGVWMRILSKVSGSVLWLRNTSQDGISRFKERVASFGVAPERIIVSDTLAPEEHYRAKNVADINLDTPRYNGHSTGADVLWSGVPSVTLMGELMASRVGGALAVASGTGELVARSMKEYEVLAIWLATSPDLLQRVKQKLQRPTPLFDTAMWVSTYERSLRCLYTSSTEGKWKRGANSHIVPGIQEGV